MSPSVFSSHSPPTQYQPSSLISRIKDTFGFWWPSRAQPFGSFVNLRKKIGGASLAAFAGRKLPQPPVRTGITAGTLSAERSCRAAHSSTPCIARLRIVFIGCRFDARDGQYKLLDVNPRIGCTFRPIPGLERNGCRASLLSRLNRPAVHAERACEGRKWLVESLDLMTLPDQ